MQRQHEDVELDETLKVDRLSATEGAVLSRLKEHGEDISLLRKELAKLQSPGVTLGELRCVVEEAVRLQAALGVPANLLNKDVLLQGGVPVEALEQARSILVTLTACDDAAERSRAHLEQGNPSPPVVLEDLEKLLAAWSDMRKLDERLRTQKLKSIASSLDLGMGNRSMTIGPLCEALLDQAVELKSALSRHIMDDAAVGQREAVDFFEKRLRNMCAQDWAREALDSLGIEIPSSSEARVPSAGASRLSGGPTIPRSPSGARSCSPSPPLGESSRVFPSISSRPARSRGSGFMSAPILSPADAPSAVPSGARSCSPTLRLGGGPYASAGSSSTNGKAFCGLADLVSNQRKQLDPHKGLQNGDIASERKGRERQSTVEDSPSVTFASVFPAISPERPADSAAHLDCAAPDTAADGLQPAADRWSQRVASSSKSPREESLVSKGMPLPASNSAHAEGSRQELWDRGAGDVNFDVVLERMQAADRAIAAVGCPAAPMGSSTSFALSASGAQPPAQKLQAAVDGDGHVFPEFSIGSSSEAPHGRERQQAISGPAARMEEFPQVAARHARNAPPELWRAVHIGDEAAVSVLIQHGACDGTMRDASGHSAFWHSIAFGHLGLAKLLLDAFPPGTEAGVDPTEVHHRRGDTLLHLLCQTRPFSADTAVIFKRVANAAPPATFEHTNAGGHSFLHFAASSLNFWVLKFVCLNHPGPTKALVCAERQAPLRFLAEAAPKPCPPRFVMPDRIPEHFALAALLSQNSSGRVPFADVAFDVGPEEGHGSSSERARFMAHRVVAGAHSPVLLEELDRLPVQQMQKEKTSACIFRVDPRISKEVWRVVLQFMYSGVINCPFPDDVARMVELLRACALYKLPKPLLEVTQSALFQLLPNCPPSVALQVFSITAGASGEDIDVRSAREASAHILLRSAPQVFQALDPTELAKILERIIQIVEYAAFNPIQTRQQVQPQQHSQNAAAVAVGHLHGASIAPSPGADAASQLQYQQLHSQGVGFHRSTPAAAYQYGRRASSGYSLSQ